jgi:hypothetical protein
MSVRLRSALDAWRAAQRRLETMPADALGREELEDLVRELRRAYRALYGEIYGGPRPHPHEDTSG